MDGQRVVIKIKHPRGVRCFPTDLQDTRGTIVASISTGGAMIVCDADHNQWAFAEGEYEIIDDAEKAVSQVKGQRVIFNAKKPKGVPSFPYNLRGTRGTIVLDIPGKAGAIIECDVDGNRWSFAPEDYTIIGKEA